MPGYTPRIEPKPENEQPAPQPQQSSLEAPKWYRIKFAAGRIYLQVNGPNLSTTALFQNDKSQYFALIPAGDGNFKLYCASGYWLSTKSGTSTNGAE